MEHIGTQLGTHSLPAGVPYLGPAEVRSILPITAAVDTLKLGLLARNGQSLDGIARMGVPMPGGELLLMPAFGEEGAGVKLVTLAPDNATRSLPSVQGVYVLFSKDGLSPELLIDGAALTSLRTSAVSALATQILARPEGGRLVVFGAGAQAAAHVEAIRAVRPISSIAILGSTPTSARAANLVSHLRVTGLDARVGTLGDVEDADIVCTCTTSTEPLFSADMVAPGTHINAVGAYRPDMCELDGKLLGSATLVVETETAALAEAGDVLRAIAHHELPSSGFAKDLSDLVSGAPVRRNAADVTVFKSVGLAVEDLILSREIAERLSKRLGAEAQRVFSHPI